MRKSGLGVGNRRSSICRHFWGLEAVGLPWAAVGPPWVSKSQRERALFVGERPHSGTLSWLCPDLSGPN